ncbi:ABC transporter substrate-binding protein [Alkaliphilus peptidifermentans]|uniref:Multiple sugar transport system substrate-binding protein n=1 Tax=Alkaliphilus peptidifermentans DSM 18978 TaxID=1120976 RepID=A0A1G5IT41_9FIRM|nr:sugar ABC transporter substrate-binding protein [Alkaliphilus peptidifermentans]SCY79265.1 multiple sugar transport system substrate-binding protein [Alkaliphilus peptidifermentans DSM 18978]
MKKSQKLLTLCLMLAIIFSGLFVGCTDKSTSDSSIDGKEIVNLKFSFWGSPFEKQAMEKALKDFEAEYDWIKVEPLYIPSDYTAKLTAMIAGNTAPDAGYISDSVILRWAEDDLFLNIFDFLENDSVLRKEDILDTAFYNWAPDKCAGLATAQEGFALMYNVEMFQKAGLPPAPTTVEDAWSWDEFVEVCKKLTIDENGKNATEVGFDHRKIKQYGLQFDNYAGVYLTVVASNNGGWLTEDGKDFGLNKPEALEALQKLADLINVHHVSPSPVQMKSLPDTSIALQTNKIAMTIGGNWSLLDFAQQDFQLGIGIMPKLDSCKTMVLSGGTAIFKTTKHPEEAWLLYRYLANPEVSLDLHAGGLWMPILRDWYTDPQLIGKWATGNDAHPEGYTDAMMNQVLNNGVAMPAFNVRNYGQMRAIVDPALDLVWLGEETAEEAMKRIEPQIIPLIEGYYTN